MNEHINHDEFNTGNFVDVNILISGGTIITQNGDREIIPDGAVAIKNGLIIGIGKTSELQSSYKPKREIHANGKFIFPGLINTHTHLFQCFMKGLGEGLPLYKWLNSVTAPSTIAMTERDGYLASTVGLLEAIRSGATTVLDYMYALPEPSLYAQVANACKDMHIRGILGWGLLESGQQHGLAPSMFRPISESLNDFGAFRDSIQSELITHALAPGIVFGISKGGLEMIRKYATDHSMLITVHINETDDDNRAANLDHGQNNIPFLDEIGFLGPDVLAVHCVKMSDADIEIFARNDVKISHNPNSNMYLGSGIAPIIKMRKAGLKVSLATDGAASNNSQDMLEILKAAGLLQKLSAGDPSSINAATMLDLATIEGARCIGRENEIGSLEVGKKADLFIFDPIHSKSVPVLDPIASLIFSAGKENVETVIINGEVVLEEGKIITVDEKALLEESQRAAMALSVRSGTQHLIKNPKDFSNRRP